MLQDIQENGTQDADLVALAKKGDVAAFEQLVTRHERKVYTLALRMLRNEHDAQDVTQQAFLSAMEHLPSFRGDSSFSTWLLRIATHAALKVVRKNKGLNTVSLEGSIEPADEAQSIPHPEYIADWRMSPEQLVHQHEVSMLLKEALAELDDKHRHVFLLRDVEGLSIQETAEALRITPANVKIRLLRARLLLRERLTRSFGDPSRKVAPHAHDE